MKPAVSAAKPPSAMSRRRRTTPTENAAIGPKSGLTAIAPTTIGAESISTATDAIAPARMNSAIRPQLRKPCCAIRSPTECQTTASAALPRASRVASSPRVETEASRCSMSMTPHSEMPIWRRSPTMKLASSSATSHETTSPTGSSAASR